MGNKFIIGDQELYVGNMSGRKKPVIMIKVERSDEEVEKNDNS